MAIAPPFAPKRKTKIGSVQQSYIPLREVREDVLCIDASLASSRRSYRAVLEVSGINYLFKSEEEQRYINDLFQVLLAGLSHPLQILIRVLPLDLDPYLNNLLPDTPREIESYPGDWPISPDPQQEIWSELARSETDFLKLLASRRTLLERHFYLIIPADVASPLDTPLQNIFSVLLPGSSRRTKADQEHEQEFKMACQQLDLRISELKRQFLTMGMYTRRLGNNELVKLYHSCLSPQGAISTPLNDHLIEGIHHFVHHDDPRPATRRPHPLVPPLSDSDLQEEQIEISRHRQRKQRGATTPVDLDWTSVANLLAPSSVVLTPDTICIEQEYARVLSIRAFPRFVSLAWLKPLAELDEPMDISFHITPRNSVSMIRQLRRKQLEFASTYEIASSKNKLIDPNVQIAQSDVVTLIEQLASGEERMLDLGFHILLRGMNTQELNARTARVQGVLSNMLLLPRSASYEQDKGLRSCLPHGKNELGAGILLNSKSAATSFPFMSNSLFMSSGILEGITPEGSPVILDWWAPTQRNANRLIIAPSGAGKSYKTKQDMIRMFLTYGRGKRAYQMLTIDPEGEYRLLTEALGGQWIRLAPGSRDHINPFDLPQQPHNSWRAGELDREGTYHGDRLSEKVQQLHALLDIMLSDRGPHGAGSLTSQEKGLLDRALYITYRLKGITSDPRTHRLPAPLMRDLYQVLASGEGGLDPTGLVQRLHRFVEGSLAGIFDGTTNVKLNASVVTFDVHDLDTELRPIGYFLISNYVWTSSYGSTIPRQLIVDEMLSLYQYEEGARFLETLFQRARKHYLGITGITQHPALLANSSIPSNCAVQILMAQEYASIDMVADLFKLTTREAQALKTCGKGDALLLSNDKRIFVHFEASPLGHRLATTDPREIASWKQEVNAHPSSHIVQTLSVYSRQQGERHSFNRQAVESDHPFGWAEMGDK